MSPVLIFLELLSRVTVTTSYRLSSSSHVFVLITGVQANTERKWSYPLSLSFWNYCCLSLRDWSFITGKGLGGR